MLTVHTTLPDAASAEALARQIIEQHLAACAHIGAPVRAFYRWQGCLETATETPLTLKTTRDRYAALELFIRAHHPYEVPEIIATPIETALPAYADWVRLSCHPDSSTANP